MPMKEEHPRVCTDRNIRSIQGYLHLGILSTIQGGYVHKFDIVEIVWYNIEEVCIR